MIREGEKSTVPSTLSQEFSSFYQQTKLLRQLLRDTLRCFQEINFAGSINGTQIVTAEFAAEDQSEVERLIKSPVAIVVLGQSTYAKSRLTNAVLDLPVLPEPDIPSRSSTAAWRGIQFKYGNKRETCLSLAGSYELIDPLDSQKVPWTTLPARDLDMSCSHQQTPHHDVKSNHVSMHSDAAKLNAVLEVRIESELLRGGVLVVVPQSLTPEVGLAASLQWGMTGVLPVILYAVTEDSLTPQETKDLQSVRERFSELPVLFVKVPPQQTPNTIIANGTAALGAIQRAIERHLVPNSEDDMPGYSSLKLFQQLVDLKYLSILPSTPRDSSLSCRECDKLSAAAPQSELLESFDNVHSMNAFTSRLMQHYLLRATNILNAAHAKCLKMFIDMAFDMARDMMITPRRLEFAREKETQLYSSLMDIAIKKQDEIRKLISETISGMREGLLEKTEEYEFMGIDTPEPGEIITARDLQFCTAQIQELVLGNLNSAIAVKLLGSVDILKDSYTGVLTRCLESLEQSDTENTEAMRTSLALREILNSAYQVDITVRGGSSFVKVLLEKMKQIMKSMPWRTSPRIDKEWKRKVAADMLDSLSEARLAKSICAQIKERLKTSHDTFSSRLRQLETRHSGRLERTEDQRIKVRKVHAPRVARLVLESTSQRDCIIYGMPVMGREIGRGQYGVVYSCEKWTGIGPYAIKSVVPPDDKHWNDLAMEFYYTKSVPEHDRIVALRGSVIDYQYGSGTAAVLLIMDRLQRDLYAAIKASLKWPARLQVAIDVVEGIRFLHSQGLVHRDIKLKNVLLDKDNRGCITDLGFCKPEAMMSGSIVGTPIHMAPELFSGKYDNSVDVYAFGVLLWYICAGHVRLPSNYEQCSNKEMLWTSVRRGVRPERLPVFSSECWDLMRKCWEGEPANRPHLGYVEPRLNQILATASVTSTSPRHSPRSREASAVYTKVGVQPTES